MRARTLRLVRLMMPGSNPIGRGVDRVEGMSLVLAVVLGTLLVPMMLMAGSQTYATTMAVAEEQARTHHQVVATLVEDAPRIGTAESGPSRVRARWSTPTGPGTGRVLAADGLDAGAHVRTWLNEDGRPVGAPASARDATLAGVVVAITGWLTAAGLLGLVHGGVKRLLDRRRYRDWALEWALVEPRWRAGQG